MALSVSRLYSVDVRMIIEYGAVGGMKIGRGNRYLETICLSATLSTTHPT
jgi:hypothetical protein